MQPSVGFTVNECPNCNEIFEPKEHIPKVLPCGHTYCAMCLHRFANYACPIDKTKYTDKVHNLPTNLLVYPASSSSLVSTRELSYEQAFAEILKENNHSNKPIPTPACGKCHLENLNVVTWCRNCACLLCDSHERTHRMEKTTIDHTFDPYNRPCTTELIEQHLANVYTQQITNDLLREINHRIDASKQITKNINTDLARCTAEVEANCYRLETMLDALRDRVQTTKESRIDAIKRWCENRSRRVSETIVPLQQMTSTIEAHNPKRPRDVHDEEPTCPTKRLVDINSCIMICRSSLESPQYKIPESSFDTFISLSPPVLAHESELSHLVQTIAGFVYRPPEPEKILGAIVIIGADGIEIMSCSTCKFGTFLVDVPPARRMDGSPIDLVQTSTGCCILFHKDIATTSMDVYRVTSRVTSSPYETSATVTTINFRCFTYAIEAPAKEIRRCVSALHLPFVGGCATIGDAEREDPATAACSFVSSRPSTSYSTACVLPSMNCARRGHFGCSVLDNQLFVFGGEGHRSMEVLSTNPLGWACTPDVLPWVLSDASAAYSKFTRKIYITGGRKEGLTSEHSRTITNDVFSYDPCTQKIESLASMPFPVVFHNSI